MTGSFETDDTICLTFDVEWAADDVIADVVAELKKRDLAATFFCTQSGIEFSGHERALHPNFRRNGDTMIALKSDSGEEFEHLDEATLFAAVIEKTKSFCPEAVGVRTHSLFFELQLLPVFRSNGLKYDSSMLMPLQPHLGPHKTMWDIIELPIFYMDHFDLVNQASDFRLQGLGLDRPGLKVFDFHPTLLFINAPTDAHYQDCKSVYGNSAALLAKRHEGRGIRDLFLDLVDYIATHRHPAPMLEQVASAVA